MLRKYLIQFNNSWHSISKTWLLCFLLFAEHYEHLLFLLFFFSVLFLYLLYNIVLVLPYIDMNLPWVYMCSPSWIPLPPPSPSHPSGSFQCISPEHPVSCIKSGLLIHFIYDNIHVSMPFSQIIPPSLSPTESKRLFCTSVSLLLSRIQGYHYHLSKFHIYALVYCIGGEGNGTPLQYSCLENPMDGRAW